MYFHGSKVGNIKELVPDLSLHNEKYVYLTDNIVVALIYTVNAIEKYYEDNNLEKPKKFQPWYSYGFNQHKIPILEEYYPNAVKETYMNKSGYIYVCEEPLKLSNPTNIHCAFVTEERVKVVEEIFVEDIYEELLKYQENNQLIIKNYYENTSDFNIHIEKMIIEDIRKYDLLNNHSNNYAVFLKAKFPHLFEQIL